MNDRMLSFHLPGASFRRAGWAVLAIVALTSCSTSRVRLARPLPDTFIRPVVAVSSFENRSGFPGEWELGSGMADLLVSELVASRNFVVVERAHLGSVVSEINRRFDGMFRPEGRIDSGRLRHAEYLVRGVINDFSQEGGGSIFVAVRQWLFGGKGYKARVSLTLTVVDVETGEILESITTSGLAMAREAYVKGTYKDIAFGGDTFFRTPLGMATANAIRRGVNGLIRVMPKDQWRPAIASARGGEIILNGGDNRRIRAGMLFDARTAGEPITDPVTGEVLSVIPGAIRGRIRVTRVEKQISFATPVRGTGFERGQRLIPVIDQP